MNGGGWQKDKDGRLYRKLGEGFKEYAAEITVPARDKAQEAEDRREEVRRKNQQHTGKACPFKNGLERECFTDCALYGDAACALIAPAPGTGTAGKECPICRKVCDARCALFNDGCGLKNIIHGLIAGKD